MKSFSLKAEERKITGKKVKQLRRDRILPANVYGKDIKSENLQLPLVEFNKVYKEAGQAGVVELNVGKKTIPVLIHNIQEDYKGNVLHVDFFKINLKEKVKTTVPIEFVGESLAEKEKVGLLMEIIHELEIEALPTNLPEKIEVNVEKLAQIDDQILVSDITTPKGVEVLTDKSQTVVKIGELITKEAQAEAEAEAEAEAQVAAEAKEEGEEVTTEEGEEKAESEDTTEAENKDEDKKDKPEAEDNKPKE